MPLNIFLAFANSEHSPLPTLSREDDDIYGMLLEDSKENGYDIIRESRATPEIINERFAQFGGEIAVFHFSGHAGAEQLLFGEEAANHQGVAYHLSKSIESGALKLVVLNGCSTAGQVKLLLELGVPAVIATNAPVEDKAATEFSTRLYYNLIKGSMDIKRAFLNAMVYAQTMRKESMNLKDKQVRGPVFLEGRDPGEPLWEVFAKNPTDVSLNPLPKQPIVVQGDYLPNERLRSAMYETLVRSENRIFVSIADDLKNGGTVGKRDIEDKMVNVLPMPIGEHLRKLFCAAEEGQDGYAAVNIKRLEQICRVYYTTMELLSVMAICQIWDRKETLSIPSELIERLREHFYMDAATRSTFGYASFLTDVLAFWVTQTIDRRFLPELSQIYSLLSVPLPDTAGQTQPIEIPFLAACNFMEELRERLVKGDPIPANEIPNLCVDAEDWLSQILGELGFLHQYHLTSVQSISILNYRHTKRSYTHSVVKLMRVNGSEKFLYELDDCLSCQGVILIKGTLIQRDINNMVFVAREGLQHLNLSPFLFDALAGALSDKSQIAIFDESFSNDTGYRFKDVTKPENPRGFIDLDERRKFYDVKKELDYYQWDMLQNPKFQNSHVRNTA